MKKHSVFTRLTGVLLAAVMLVTMIPFASADGEYVLTENYLGEDISYTFDPATGKLTVTGTGRLADWAFDWKDEIQSVEICDGIQSIGDGVFYFCQNLKTVSLPASVVEINSNAFYGTALEEITYGGTEEKFLDIALGYGGTPIGVDRLAIIGGTVYDVDVTLVVDQIDLTITGADVRHVEPVPFTPDVIRPTAVRRCSGILLTS